MTFSDWYAANVANTFPPGMPDIAKKAARQAMAACWNAAIDAYTTELQKVATGHIREDICNLNFLLQVNG